jgi:hypothetical protein
MLWVMVHDKVFLFLSFTYTFCSLLVSSWLFAHPFTTSFCISFYLAYRQALCLEQK